MTAEPDRPHVAAESGRPAASDDPVTERAAVAPDEIAEENARPDEELFETLRERGWSGEPFVVRGGEVLGNAEMYAAAEQLGIADRVPRVGLYDVFREAGYDADRLVEGYGPNRDSEQILQEDFLDELPRHIRDKYSI
jgi:hypothetical protein